MQLTSQGLREQFEKEGYVVVKNFFSPEEMTTLMNHIKSAKTRNGESGIDRGSLTFYSSLFFYSKPIQSFMSQQRIIDLLTPIIGPDFWVRWDQAVVKGPGAGIFPWHQDNAYSDLKEGYYQLWIAMTEMSPDNGGLWLVPRSHKQLLPHRQTGNHLEWEGTPENPVFIAAEPGDVVLFSSFMLHKTNPNVTQNPRWTYVIEYMSAEHFDPGVKPPYFVVSRNGISQPEFVHFYRGRLNLMNHLKYFGFRWKSNLLNLGSKMLKTRLNLRDSR
ncbi:MAG: phytanoyl-CoA dioxygenase family protein [Microcoleaceae cyanobacterium]